MFELRYGVLEQVEQRRLDARGIDADVLPGAAKRSRPAPGVAEHALVQAAHKLDAKQVLALARKGPALAFR